MQPCPDERFFPIALHSGDDVIVLGATQQDQCSHTQMMFTQVRVALPQSGERVKGWVNSRAINCHSPPTPSWSDHPAPTDIPTESVPEDVDNTLLVPEDGLF